MKELPKYKVYESSKPFYGKYIYKVGLEPKNLKFSFKNFPFQGIRTNSPTKKKTLAFKEIIDNILFSINIENYRSRGENGFVNVFFDEKEDLLKFIKKTKNDDRIIVLFVEKPDPKFEDYLKNHKNLVINDYSPEFPLRCTFRGKGFDSEAFSKWIEANPEKIYLSKQLKKDFQRFRNPFLSGRYFYVKNTRTLNMIEFIIGGSIRKVEYLASKEELETHGGPVEK